MRLIWLVRYFTVFFAMSVVASQFTTTVPNARTAAMVWDAIFAWGAFVGAFICVWVSRLPSEHWVHHYRPLWTGFVVVALTVVVCFYGVFAVAL